MLRRDGAGYLGGDPARRRWRPWIASGYAALALDGGFGAAAGVEVEQDERDQTGDDDERDGGGLVKLAAEPEIPDDEREGHAGGREEQDGHGQLAEAEQGHPDPDAE